MKNKIVAIVPAAGIGKRFGKGKNKSFFELSGKPLIIRVLETLQGVAEIDEIIPVLKKNDIKSAVDLIKRYNISKARKIVPGGKQRQDSVYNGLMSLDDNTSVVVIHDGARPFADSNLIRRTIKDLLRSGNPPASPFKKGGDKESDFRKGVPKDGIFKKEGYLKSPPFVKGGEGGFDGVVAGMPVKDTIKEVRIEKSPLHNPPLSKGGQRGGKDMLQLIVSGTLNRDVLWAIQTPQTFYYRKIRDAHERARAEGYYSTDDAALIEKYGGRVKVIMGSHSNIKITTPEDIYTAEALLKMGF